MNYKKYSQFKENRLVHFNEVPVFDGIELASLKRQKEVQEPEELDINSLADEANKTIEKHRDKLKHLPQSFNSHLHNELVNYFLSSPERYDRDKEKGLDQKEFANFRKDMVKQAEAMFTQYAPTEEQIKAMEEAKEGIKKSKSKPAPKIELSEISNDPGEITDLYTLEDKLMDYEDYNARLAHEGKSAIHHVNSLNAHYEKYQESLNGLKAYRKFAALFGGGGGRETYILKENINRGKKMLEKRIERFQKIQEKIKEYGSKLASASNWLREKEIRAKQERLEKLKPEQREKGEQFYKEAFKDWTELDRQIDGAVLKNNVAHQYTLNNMEVQRKLFDHMNFEPAGIVESTAGAALSVIAGVTNKGGDWFIGVAEKIANKINRAEKTTNPLLWGLKKGGSIVVTAPIVVPGLLLRMGGGVVGMAASPIETFHGVSALVGLNKNISTVDIWLNMGKEMAGIEDFKKLNIGIGIAKIFVSIVTTATGAGALRAGGKAAANSLKIARAAELSALQTMKEMATAATKAGAESIKEAVQSGAKSVKDAPSKIREAVKERAKFKEIKNEFLKEIDARMDTDATRGDIIKEMAERAETHQERLAIDEIANQQFKDYDIDPNTFCDLVNDGHIMPTDYSLFRLLDLGVPIPKKLIISGRVKVSASLIDSIVHDEEMLKTVHDLIEKGKIQGEPGVNLKRVQKVIEHHLKRMKIENDAMNLGNIIYANPKWLEKVETAIKAIEAGEKPTGVVAEVIHSLKSRDPLGYKIIKDCKDLKHLGETEAIQGIIRGNKVEFYNHLGQKVEGYLGKYLGQGGFGVVDNFIYMENGEVHFTAIKRPLDTYGTTGRAMYLEAKTAEKLIELNSDNLIKVLHVEENGKFVIYETGKKTKDMLELTMGENPIPVREYFEGIKTVIRGAQDYHKREVFHGDIKPKNVLGMKSDKAKSHKFKVIDNSMNSFDKAIDPNLSWFRTPMYSFEPVQLEKAIIMLKSDGKSPQEIAKIMGRSIDPRAIGQMLDEGFSQYFGHNWRDIPELKAMVKPLMNPISAGQPGVLEKLSQQLSEFINKYDRITLNENLPPAA